MKKALYSLVVASVLVATAADAGSIGRSGGGFSSGGSRSSSSSSVSRSSSYSAPAPKAPSAAPAPAPSHSGGIGGTSSSVGVRKSEVTNGVRNDIAATKPAPVTGSTGTSGSSGSYAPHYTPTPSYSAPPPVVVQSSGFGSSFMGALGGTIVGNALFGNHNNGGGTTVINNGTPANSGTVSGGQIVSGGDGQVSSGTTQVVTKKEYTVWSFIADVFGFVIVVALLLGVAWVFYKGFQMVRNFINKERGVSNIPFNPTQQFWRIQRAFAEANVTELKALLGPDVVDELTNGLTASTMTLHNVSHEVRLANNNEFSIWYKFEDDGSEVNQVWHYERFGKEWLLNGIENV